MFYAHLCVCPIDHTWPPFADAAAQERKEDRINRELLGLPKFEAGKQTSHYVRTAMSCCTAKAKGCEPQATHNSKRVHTYIHHQTRSSKRTGRQFTQADRQTNKPTNTQTINQTSNNAKIRTTHTTFLSNAHTHKQSDLYASKHSNTTRTTNTTLNTTYIQTYAQPTIRDPGRHHTRLSYKLLVQPPVPHLAPCTDYDDGLCMYICSSEAESIT